VVRYRKKIVVFLITVVLGSGVLLLSAFAGKTPLRGTPLCGNPKQVSGQSATDETKLASAEAEAVAGSEDSKPKGSLLTGESKTGSLFDNESNFSLRTSNRPGNQKLFFKMMLSVLFLVALSAAAIYVSKRFLPKITNLQGKKIRIAETVHLGPRKAVHLLEIGNRRLLIGSTNENITRLADLTTLDAGYSSVLRSRATAKDEMLGTRRESSFENQESRIEDINGR